MPAFLRLLPLLLLLTGCASTATKQATSSADKARVPAPAAVWDIETLRFEGEGSHERIGVSIAPDLIATSLDVASYPERLTGMFLIEGGSRTASITHAISGNAGDLDVALMRVVDLGSYVPVERQVSSVTLCQHQVPAGGSLVALGRGDGRHALTVGAELSPGYHTREITDIQGDPESGAPVISGDCLAGIFSNGRLIQASGLQYLLSLMKP